MPATVVVANSSQRAMWALHRMEDVEWLRDQPVARWRETGLPRAASTIGDFP